jgi:hypothetical protein
MTFIEPIINYIILYLLLCERNLSKVCIILPSLNDIDFHYIILPSLNDIDFHYIDNICMNNV